MNLTLSLKLSSEEGHPLRTSSFIPGTNHPLTELFVRRKGRPCKEWVRTMLNVAVRTFGNMNAVENAAANVRTWEAEIGCRLVREI